MESLEENVCGFMDEYYYSNESESHGSPVDLWWEENETYSNEPPQRTMYWESQLALLQEILERYQLSGMKLRKEVEQIVEEVKASDYCNCIDTNSFDCTTCLRREVVVMLRERGFTTNLCLSKWTTTHKFPGGSHEYIEVIASTLTRKKQIKFLIELELKDHFQIAKAGEEYQELISTLPEFYIGKPEYLNALVRVMCDAAKKSMKEKKMYIGPWRKSSFMQMKWSGFNKKWTSENFLDRLGTQATEPYLRIKGASPAVVVT
ncbi:hypothetical protein TanjilG_03466 [Lupinus angustifolius]|uniref:Uncharacterized protein n=2 Tax=Lupinus angustifolius TaxID=3871 RepID=A0A1J7GZG2_LUPAN|nr:PREDICTED: uncharacterized protein LOC109331769 isoform X1 [Lupinus angustifolius]XP_019443559.1 PREDICTED: uncharacterized protein LOC109347898 isoform X1 [Lupinus angustifolius]OIV94948.1 hypothetical protein TanjilG_22145 [Lupinus angustifolius]OIW11805.1 hypothetical protein TanjilG_03466 [Lupinus angustifolius]